MKKFLTILLAASMTASMGITAFADTRVESASVRINEQKEEPGVVYPIEITSGTRGVEIGDISMSKEYDEWHPGKKVTISVTLLPEEGYSFSKSKTKVSVSNGQVASTNVRTDEVEVKINYIPSVTLAPPSNIYFEDEYTAKWDKVEFAQAYDVKIITEDDDGRQRNKTIQVTKPEVDLGQYATESDVTFEVRATAKDSTSSKYLKASEWVSCDDSVSVGDNTTTGKFNGKQESQTFKQTDGTNATGWQFISGSWYYFDPDNNNKAVNNAWKMINGKWYHFNEFNIMQTGWLNLNGTWYFLNPDGDMATGWITGGPAGPWYYLDPVNGNMWVNATTPDGYWVNEKGEWYP